VKRSWVSLLHKILGNLVQEMLVRKELLVKTNYLPVTNHPKNLIHTPEILKNAKFVGVQSTNPELFTAKVALTRKEYVRCAA